MNAFLKVIITRPSVTFPFLKKISIAHYGFFKLFMKKLFSSNSKGSLLKKTSKKEIEISL